MHLDPYIADSRRRLKEIEKQIARFDFDSGSQDEYRELNREYQQLAELMKCWDRRADAARELTESTELLETEEDEEFLEMIRAEIESLENELAKLDGRIKSLVLPPDPDEGRNMIVEIRPAAGGDEAGLFAGDLLRMYSRFAEHRGWTNEILEVTENAVGGIKGAAFCLKGSDVCRYMRLESGVHRVQRIPVTESSGRIHTSTVTVAVLPEAEAVDLKISTEELRIDVFKSSGPGGQSVNTTDSAVRITHLPTGLVVTSQQEKSQHRNKNIALRILRSRLLEHKKEEEEAKSAAQRRSQVGTGDRSERIRTYNFPQNRVSDHRFGITLYDLTNIMEGMLDELLTQIIAADVEQRLEEITNRENSSD